MSRFTQERRKIEYRRATNKKSTRFAVEFFCPTSRSIQESEGFFLPTSYIQGQVRKCQGSRWLRQGWSIPTKRGREKVKKRKRPRKVRRWLQRSQGFPCALNLEFLFFGSRVFGFGSGPSRLKYQLLRFFSTWKPCAKEVPAMDYFMQRKQYLKRTTLHTYSAKAVP